MKVKQLWLFLIVLLFVAISFPSFAGDPPKIVGVYTEVPGQEFVFDGKSVEIVEFLSFYCSHCYKFEKSIPVVKGNFPKKIKWKTVPIYWGKGSPKPGEAYLLAVEEGKGEQMKKAIFEALFLKGKDIGQIEVLEEIGAKIGLGFDFSTRLRADDKSAEAKKQLELANKYQVNETPSLIIAGNLKTSPGMLNNNMELLRDNAILILKSLFEK
jgi:thiol:disulfide interchange protein DsbA